MDKKQNLTPELKAIYDRVMNTQVAPSAATVLPATPVTPQPQVQIPSVPAAPVAPPPPAPSSQPASQQVMQQPSGGFTYSAQGAANNPTVTVVAHNGNSFAKLIVFGGIVFFIGYIIFWLKFFKYL